jgi:hypothetical protein
MCKGLGLIHGTESKKARDNKRKKGEREGEGRGEERKGGKKEENILYIVLHM